MGPVYGVPVLENCLTCPVRTGHFFCNLSIPALQRLNEIKAVAVYPKRAVLFVEGQQPRGFFVLCTGRAKLSASSFSGKTIITRVSESGDVLGLNAVVSNRPYEVTAEMIEPGQANFVSRDSLQEFRTDHEEVALRLAEQLSRDYYAAYEEIRILGLTRSPSQKFAKLLLSWCTNTAENDWATQVRLTLHREEIADMLDTTRETVSRLVSKFKKKGLLQLKGKTIVIKNRRALEKIGPRWDSEMLSRT